MDLINSSQVSLSISRYPVSDISPATFASTVARDIHGSATLQAGRYRPVSRLRQALTVLRCYPVVLRTHNRYTFLFLGKSFCQEKYRLRQRGLICKIIHNHGAKS